MDVPAACVGLCGDLRIFFIHLYLGTMGNPGTVQAMIGVDGQGGFEEAASGLASGDGA